MGGVGWWGGGGEFGVEFKPLSNSLKPSHQTFGNLTLPPSVFTLTSIDAEGVGDMVLNAWLSSGYSPEYVLSEPMHTRSGSGTGGSRGRMESLGYRWMGRWGWNDAFERVRRCGEEEGGGGGGEDAGPWWGG